MLSLTMFLLLVADAMPQTSGAIPLIGMYFSCIMVMCSCSVVFTVLVLNYHHRSADTAEAPVWIRRFINTWLASMLFMRRRSGRNPESVEKEILYQQAQDREKRQSCYSSARRRPRKPQPGGVNTLKNGASIGGSGKMSDLGIRERSSKSLLANVLDLDDDFRIRTTSSGLANDYRNSLPGLLHQSACLARETINLPHNQCPPHPPPTNQQSKAQPDLEFSPTGGPEDTQYHLPPNSICSTKSELSSILRELRFISNKIKDDEVHTYRANEWKFAARVIDRCCLIVFSLFTFISSCAILLSPDPELEPYGYNPSA